MTITIEERPSPIANLENWFNKISLLDSVSALTFVLAVFFGFEQALFRLGVQIALVAILLKPAFIRTPALWLTLSIFATIVLVGAWSTADNHKYLFVYWLWVVTFARFAEADGLSEKVLWAHARFFLVFVFLAAVTQKLCSPTYLSGEMFELKLLLDERFKAFGHLIGINRTIPEGVNVEIASLKSALAVYENNSIAVSSNDYVRQVAVAITWYDLVVQIAIGLLFIPARQTTDRIGHLVLLFFIFTTYLPAPVFGFGWTLAIYGFTLAKGRFPYIMLGYAASFVAILAYQAPWRQWVLEW